MAETIDLTPSADGYVSIGAALIHNVIYTKVTRAEQQAAAAMLVSVLDLTRYLAVLDHRTGTHHLAALLQRSGLTAAATAPPERDPDPTDD